MSSTSLKSAEEALFANYLTLRPFFNSKSATASTGAKGSTWQILKSSRKTWWRPDAGDGEAVLGCISWVMVLAEFHNQTEPQPLPGLTQCFGCPHAPCPSFYSLFYMRRKDAVGHLCKVAHSTLETLRHYHWSDPPMEEELRRARKAQWRHWMSCHTCGLEVCVPQESLKTFCMSSGWTKTSVFLWSLAPGHWRTHGNG